MKKLFKNINQKNTSFTSWIGNNPAKSNMLMWVLIATTIVSLGFANSKNSDIKQLQKELKQTQQQFKRTQQKTTSSYEKKIASLEKDEKKLEKQLDSLKKDKKKLQKQLARK